MSETSTLTEADAQAFRERCRTFLDEHATGMPSGARAADDRGRSLVDAAKAFQMKLAEAGLAGLTFPKEYGGQGLSRAHERIWREEYARYPDMTSELTISHGMCLPVLNDFGTHEQKARFLAKNISGEEVWCQMFSERAPAPTSPASRRGRIGTATRGHQRPEGLDHLAHHSDYGVLIARTNPDAPKHAGISMFIVDMRAPGVEIRPIHQIDGSRHFNEVFFTDMRIPADWLLGELNNGWNQATAMLMYERVAIGTGSTSGVNRPNADRLIEEATSAASSPIPCCARTSCASTPRRPPSRWCPCAPAPR